MERNRVDKIFTRIAGFFSDFFSPIMMPAYMMAISMWLTPLIAIPERIRFINMGLIALITAIVPVATILILIKLGKVHDVSISNRNERYVPYCVSLLCYFVAYIYLKNVHAPVWLSGFYLGAAIVSLIAVAITIKWKISAHASSVAGFASAIIWLALHDLFLIGQPYWIVGSILLCGIIGTSRLLLNRHTVMQVFAGFALGAVVIFTTLELIN